MLFRIFIVFLLLLFNINLLAQFDNINVRQISPESGYSFKAIGVIKQDLTGYMWFGTDHGVIRYDSRTSEWFTYSPVDSLGLPGNSIHCITVDDNNVVWISTENGLCFFDRELQNFRKVPVNYEDGSPVESPISSIIIDENNDLWFYDNKYFGIFDRETKQFNRIIVNQPFHITKLFSDYMKRIWFGNDKGDIYRLSPDKKSYTKFVEGFGVPVGTMSIGNDEILVGYLNHGIRRFNFQGKLTKHFRFDDLGNNIENINARSLLRDTYGRIWIGGYDGLYLYQDQKIFKFNTGNYDGMPHNSIYELFEDNQGGLWIGTWAGGVGYIHPSDNNFKNYQYSKSPNALSNSVVSSFSQYKKNQLLIGTEVGGINIFNKSTKEFTSLFFSGDVCANNIKAIKTDQQRGIWIATFRQGLWYKAKGKNEFINISYGDKDGEHISDQHVYALCEVDSGMFIGTFGGGINFYNFETQDIFYIYRPKGGNNTTTENYIRSIFSDSYNNIWVGTIAGLYKINQKKRKLEKYHFPTNSVSISGNNIVYFITELSDHKIWFGINNEGIIILDQQNNQVERLNAGGLLNGKDVYGIIEDDNSNIWITSNNGLIFHNPKNKSFRQFVALDGIQGDVFNPQAIFKDNEGYLYFGGTKGFTQINPLNIRLNSREAKSIIKEVIINSKESKYPTELSEFNCGEILLEPTETTIRIEFTSDSYLLPEKNRFKYRLVNYVDEWIEAGNDGYAMFTNLPNGEYVFEVKACNNDGIWNETPTKLPIHILKFWYKTNLAYLIYSLLIIGLIIMIIRFFIERSKFRKGILIEKIQHKHEEQMYEMRLKFFTNISHELRTPLTLITGPIKKMVDAENIPAEHKEKLSVVKRNSDRLLLLINQTLNLRKSEKVNDKLWVSEFDIVKLVKELHLHFKEQAKTSNIQFEFDSSQPEILIEADEQKIDKVVFNLLSNAFKNTPDNGRILVSVSDKEEQEQIDFPNQLSFGELENKDVLRISVLDSGKGIKSEDLGKIFNRFEQGEFQEGLESLKKLGTGIGLSLCKEFTLLHNGMIKGQSFPGKRAKFTVALPKKQEVQKILQEDLVESKKVQSKEYYLNKVENKKEEKGKFQLLIIEDNDDLREYIGSLLGNKYKIKYAPNGKEGLGILNTSPVDLVISDVMMPEMDGYEFCKIVKSQLETSHVPVILLTALSSNENRILGLDIGADAYFTKPFEDKVLLSQVSNLISQRNRVQQNFKNIFLSDKTFEAGNLDNYFLNKLNKIIDARYTNEEFTVEELSFEIGLSRSQLHRKLVNLTNRSTSEYIRLYRIKKASELLSTNQYQVDEIAYRVGFNSPSYFSTCFKNVYNLSPKEFMKSMI